MSVLQSLDNEVFRFINGTLSNRFCDWLMPVFAGGSWFLPLVFALGALWLWRGGPRARLCGLMLAIVLPIGDGLVTNSIKHAVDRPRPCRTLDKVNLPMRQEQPRDDDDNEFHRGCTGTGSMPSGHTTNWFSALMVALLFYRRSWRFMLPMACVVGFSRIYNGVHYPSDVLAGAIIGAGYGLALSFGANFLWQRLVRPSFPVWCRNLPSLLPLENSKLETRNPQTGEAACSIEAHWLRLGYVLIAAIFCTQVWYIASGRIELSQDEAYQWLWSKHLALSYFSKPPLIAYTQWLGTHLFGDTELGVRFFAPVCAVLGSLVALLFFRKQVSARAGFWVVAACNVTPLLAVGSALMTVDPLLVLFWNLAMFTGWRAVHKDGRTGDWALVGLWMGLAFLSKYAAVIQWICWALFFVLWKPARLHLRRPGPYLAFLINALVTLPVWIWNAQHHWITVEHVGHNGHVGEAWEFKWGPILEFLSGSFGLMHPFFFVGIVIAAVLTLRRSRNQVEAMVAKQEDSQRPLLLYFLAMGAPIYLLCALYTIHSRVQMNWIAAAVIPLLCLMVAFWEKRHAEKARPLRIAFAVAMVLGILANVVAHETDLVKKFCGLSFPAKWDPLRRVRGWKETARVVERACAALEAEGKPVFVLVGHYGNGGELSFYMPTAKTNVTTLPLVYCLTEPRPKDQFYFWPSYLGVRRGQNAIYARELEKGGIPPELLREFASVTEIDSQPVRYRGRELRVMQMFVCRDLQR